MLRQSINQVNIKGKLEEVDLTKRTDKSGRDYISGTVTLLVNQTVNAIPQTSHVQVSVFAYKTTKAGKDNPAYTSAADLMENGVSIAACGSEKDADWYQVGGASLSTNTFENREGKDITYTMIRGSFFSKPREHMPVPEATFEQEIVIAGLEDEVVDDVPTGRLQVKGICIGYNGIPDSFVYYVDDEQGINFIKTNWQVEDTVKINGYIRMESKTVEVEGQEEVGFGVAPTKTYDRTIKEYIITSGSAGRLAEEKCYNPEEVADAIELKKKNYEQAKIARKNASQSGSTGRLSRGF